MITSVVHARRQRSSCSMSSSRRNCGSCWRHFAFSTALTSSSDNNWCPLVRSFSFGKRCKSEVKYMVVQDSETWSATLSAVVRVTFLTFVLEENLLHVGMYRSSKCLQFLQRCRRHEFRMHDTNLCQNAVSMALPPGDGALNFFGSGKTSCGIPLTVSCFQAWNNTSAPLPVTELVAFMFISHQQLSTNAHSLVSVLQWAPGGIPQRWQLPVSAITNCPPAHEGALVCYFLRETLGFSQITSSTGFRRSSSVANRVSQHFARHSRSHVRGLHPWTCSPTTKKYRYLHQSMQPSHKQRPLADKCKSV